MGNERKKAFAYIRVSTGMQVEGYSLDNQRERIERKAYGENIDIVEWFADEGKSGKSIEGREEFRRMLEKIDAGADVQFVMVYKLSRFGRNAADVMTSLERIRLNDTELYCVEDGIDSSKDAGKLVISVLAAVSEIERENIIAQTMGGRRQKAREGKWNGGMAPYGYKIGTGKQKGILQVVPEAAEHVKMIYELYLNQHMGISRIADYMTDRGYRKIERQYVNPNPNRRKSPESEIFAPAFVKGVLDNPAYMGKIPYERRRTKRVSEKKDDKVHVKYVKEKQGDGDYGLYDGLHEAIVDKDTWYAVHARRLETGVACDRRHDLDHVHLLTGILKCPVCGANMYSNPNRKKKKDGSGEYYETEYYYCCKHRKMVGDHRCDYHRQFKQSRINLEALDAIMDAQSSKTFINEVKARMNAAVDTKQQEKELAGLKKTRRQIEATIEKISDQMDRLDATDAMYDRKYADLEKRQNDKYDALGRLEDEINILDAKVRRVMRATTNYKEAMIEVARKLNSWGTLPEQEKKELFQKYFKSIEIFEDPKPGERIIKKIIFQFPVEFMGGATPETDMTYQGIVDGKERWEAVGTPEIGDEVRWDRLGNVECIAVMSKVHR